MNLETVSRRMRYVLLVFALLALAGNSFISIYAKPADPKLDARRLKTGRFLYRTLLNGKDAGNSDISVRKLPGSDNFIYTTHVTGQLSQQWEAVATETFMPISAKLTFGDGDNMRPAFELKYQNARVTGFRLARRADVSSKVEVDAEVQSDTVDQRIDWAAAMSQNLVPGREFTFHVFDPGTGQCRVTGRIAGPETVKVPAGTFEAMRIVYRMEKASGSEVYQVLTNREGLRMLLREEFPDGAVTELLKVKEWQPNGTDSK
jgi:hypothetical protein